MKQKRVLVKSYFVKIKTDKREQMWQAKPNDSEWQYSNCKIDSERLNNDLQLAIESLNTQGYKVVQITPITSGDYNFSDHLSDPHLLGSGVTTEGGYGYGFSYTDSLVILAEQLEGVAVEALTEEPMVISDEVIIVD